MEKQVVKSVEAWYFDMVSVLSLPSNAVIFAYRPIGTKGCTLNKDDIDFVTSPFPIDRIEVFMQKEGIHRYGRLRENPPNLPYYLNELSRLVENRLFLSNASDETVRSLVDVMQSGVADACNSSELLRVLAERKALLHACLLTRKSARPIPK